MKSRIQKGMIAGFAATAVVAILEVAKLYLTQSTGALAEVRIFPLILAAMVGMQGSYLVGWAIHFVSGTLILGPAFGILCPRMPTDTPATKGIAFAVGAFILMSLTVAPVAGIGMFAMAAGFPTLMWLIFTHIVFGIVMGGVYGTLVQREKRHAREMAGAQPAH
ncbi:MAG: hypothetical protein ACI8U3_002175 [Brevundimonas sp.]|jgi:hypothetical protein|uniref:DUF6789 family protein n=1 Tax=Brevundimonas sp. TaxID=1871086 RepID=UPI0039E48FF0